MLQFLKLLDIALVSNLTFNRHNEYGREGWQAQELTNATEALGICSVPEDFQECKGITRQVWSLVFAHSREEQPPVT